MKLDHKLNKGKCPKTANNQEKKIKKNQQQEQLVLLPDEDQEQAQWMMNSVKLVVKLNELDEIYGVELDDVG